MNIVYSKSKDRWFRAVPVNREGKFRLGAFGLLPQLGDCISELFSGPPSVWEHALPHGTVVMATHVSAGNPIYSVYTLGKPEELDRCTVCGDSGGCSICTGRGCFMCDGTGLCTACNPTLCVDLGG